MNTQPMWMFDPNSLRFLAVNNAAIWNYGYTRADFMTMTLFDIRPPEDIKIFRSNLLELKGDKLYADPVRHKYRDGTIKDVQVVCYSIQHQEQPAYLVTPLPPPNVDPVILELQQAINRFEFTLLQHASDDRKRFAELRSLCDQLNVAVPVSKQLIVIERIKALITDFPNASLN